jgi:hypothetical protein
LSHSLFKISFSSDFSSEFKNSSSDLFSSVVSSVAGFSSNVNSSGWSTSNSVDSLSRFVGPSFDFSASSLSSNGD